MQASSRTRADETAKDLYTKCVDSPQGLQLPSGRKLNTKTTEPAKYTQTLDEEGTYYFYCGVSGHCKDGVKAQIIVKVDSSDCPAETKCTKDDDDDEIEEDYCSVTWTHENSKEGGAHNICVEEGNV